MFEPLFSRGGWTSYANVDLDAFLNADFAVAAFLISFGGLIGKVNPTQLTILTIVESFFYCMNKRWILERWIPLGEFTRLHHFALCDTRCPTTDGQLNPTTERQRPQHTSSLARDHPSHANRPCHLTPVDVGGTIIIHMFGAYFGLAVSYVLGKKPDMSKESSSPVSDILSLIGTITLWVYWPSFVGGSLTSGTSESELALTNTMTSLIGSTLITFALSALYNGKVRPVDIQNATLAGGVAIGATANLDISPSVALAIGFGAGTISCVGYNRVQDWLHEKVGLGNRNFTASNPRFHHH